MRKIGNPKRCIAAGEDTLARGGIYIFTGCVQNKDDKDQRIGNDVNGTSLQRNR